MSGQCIYFVAILMPTTKKKKKKGTIEKGLESKKTELPEQLTSANLIICNLRSSMKGALKDYL